MRRNLQNEHLSKLIELSLEQDSGSPAARTLQSLVRLQLNEIKDAIDIASASDTYTRAHLADASTRIQKALDAQFAVVSAPAPTFNLRGMFGEDAQ